jgi:hypothetical protein
LPGSGSDGPDDGRALERDPDPAALDLGAAAATTRRAESARVVLRSGSGRRPGEEIPGVMTFGEEGRGVFSMAEIDPGLSELRALPEATYLHHERGWVRFEHEEFTSANGLSFGPDRNPLLGTVEFLVDALRHAEPGSVAPVGTDASHDDPVTVYEARIDVRRAIESVAEVVDAASADLLFSRMGRSVTIWIDELGRVRLISIEGGEGPLEIELWDFGVDVVVDAPPTALSPDDLLAEQALPAAPAPPAPDEAWTTEAFCAEIVGALPLFVREPTADVEAWRTAGMRMVAAAKYSPPALEGSTAVQAERYLAVADLLQRGTSIDTVVAAGLFSGGGHEPWDVLQFVEQAAFTELASICG